jgi:hypothetical protein
MAFMTKRRIRSFFKTLFNNVTLLFSLLLLFQNASCDITDFAWVSNTVAYCVILNKCTNTLKQTSQEIFGPEKCNIIDQFITLA